MKNRQRNDVFGMVAVDLFAGAMGVFLILAMIAFPYYLKIDKVYIEQVKVLTNVVINLQNELDNIKHKMIKLDDELKSAKNKVTIQKQEIERLKQQVTNQNNQITELEKALELLEEQLRKCKSERLKLRQRLDNKELELQIAQQDLQVAKSQLSTISKLYTTLKEEVLKYKKALAKKDYDNIALHYQNKKLELENKELKSRDDNKIIQDLKAKNEEIKRELLKTFCVVNISWDNPLIVDIDLHIEDPQGKLYYYDKRRHDNNDATFIVDSKNVRKGAEVWLTTELKQGVYKIYYHFYSGVGVVNVRGQVFTKSFTKEIPLKIIGKVPMITANKKLVAEIIVDQDGNAEFRLR